MSAAKTLMSEGYKELRMARNYSQNETFQLKKKKTRLLWKYKNSRYNLKLLVQTIIFWND